MGPLFRRGIPISFKSLARDLRQVIASPPVDDVAQFEYPVEPDASSVPRLTSVLQYLTREMNFGSAATANDLFGRLAAMLGQIEPVDVRFFVTEANARTDPGIIIKCAAKAWLAITPDQIELVSSSNHTIQVMAREVFLPIIWWNTVNFAKVPVSRGACSSATSSALWCRTMADGHPRWRLTKGGQPNKALGLSNPNSPDRRRLPDSQEGIVAMAAEEPCNRIDLVAIA
jgi:hypothetical protein